MPVQKTENIWHNGKLIPWEDAKIHVMSHVVHYGSSVFEGIRCYTPGVFRLPEHMTRLIESAKIYRMPLPYTADQLSAAVVDVIEANALHGGVLSLRDGLQIALLTVSAVGLGASVALNLSPRSPIISPERR